MPIIIFLLWLELCFYSAYLLSRRSIQHNNFIALYAFNLVLGIALQVLLAHILAFVVQSFSLACFVSIALFFLLSLWFTIRITVQEKVNLVKEILENFRLIDIYIFIVAIAIGISMYFRDQIFGSPDRIHTAIIGVITNNNIYPPSSPVGSDFSLSNYHYGTDLVGSLIKTITGLMSFDAISLQIGLGAFLTFVALYSVIALATESRLSPLFASIVVFFFSSINSLEYFFREFNRLFSSELLGYLREWLLISWTSISHITSQMRLPSQNIALGFCFVLIYLLLGLYAKDTKNKLWFLIPISFILYFCYPTFWYPVLVAVLLYGVVICLKNRGIDFQYIYILVALYLGKVLCFNHAEADTVSISTLVLKPSLDWVHWGKSYIRYFYDLGYLSSLGRSYDPVTGNSLLGVPLFSSISFRDFGFSTLIATIIFVYELLKKRFNYTALLYFAAFISLTVPFVIQFILRPIEITRFILTAKILFTVYIAVKLVEYAISKLPKYILVALSVILIVPGIVSIIPNTKLAILRNKAVNQEDRAMVKALESVHQSGDIALDPRDYDIGSQFSGLAGFYGLGGQLYKKDTITWSTALELMNPSLLREMEVSHVMVYPDTKLSDMAYSRLSDKSLFELTEFKDLGLKVYKFKPDESLDLVAYKSEYLWAIGYQGPRKFTVMQTKEGDIISDNRESLEDMIDRVKLSIKLRDPIMAFWLNIQAVAQK